MWYSGSKFLCLLSVMEDVDELGIFVLVPFSFVELVEFSVLELQFQLDFKLFWDRIKMLAYYFCLCFLRFYFLPCLSALHKLSSVLLKCGLCHIWLEPSHDILSWCSKLFETPRLCNYLVMHHAEGYIIHTNL